MKLYKILIICLLLLSLEACRKVDSPAQGNSSFKDLSEQGLIKCRQGNYVEGLRLLQEANDMLSTVPADSVAPKERVKFLGNLANLYSRMGLHEEAKQTNYQATVIADKYALPIRADLWRMRGVVYQYSGQPDSMFICLDRSREFCALIDDEAYRNKVKQRLDEEHAWIFIEHPDYAPDSIPKALAYLERVISEHPDNPVDKINTDRFLLGRAYVLMGNPSRGLPMMEDALEEYRKIGDDESVEWGLQLLAKSYADAGDCKLTQIYPAAAARHDTIMQRRNDDRLLGMDFKYRTSQLKRDKAALVDELKAKRQKIVFISVIAVIIVAGVSLFSVMHNRNNKRLLSLKQQNIDNLLSERIILNTRIEELNKATADSNTETKRREVLQTILLEKEDEQRFRKSFNDLHPGFIDRLRRDYPGLTSGNELLCMLIAMRRNNEEIALALGISRESVATSRYRLRCRFDLSKDVDLNDFIISKL